MRPVFHDQERPIDDVEVVGRDLQLVDRFVEAGMRVHVRAEAHPEALDEGGDVLTGKVRRAVEGHVLDEVRQPALVIVFEHRTGVHHQAQLGSASGRRVVAAHVVLEAIRQSARAHFRGDRNHLGERRRCGPFRRRLGGGEAGRDGNREKRKNEASHRCRHGRFSLQRVGERPLSSFPAGPARLTRPA